MTGRGIHSYIATRAVIVSLAALILFSGFGHFLAPAMAAAHSAPALPADSASYDQSAHVMAPGSGDPGLISHIQSGVVCSICVPVQDNALHRPALRMVAITACDDPAAIAEGDGCEMFQPPRTT